ncbi:hypothetical protein SLA2020_499590 [Shorea laevis]
MEELLGLLRIRVKKGTNLAVRDTSSSDPFVVVTMDPQKLKTRVVKNTCNPEWKEELTLSIKEPVVPIHLTVYDKDTFTVDDKMGDAEISIEPYIEVLRTHKGSQDLPEGCALKKIQPDKKNCLAAESSIVWRNGKIIQDLNLRLNNVECGEVEVQLEWIDVPGCKGVGGEEVLKKD